MREGMQHYSNIGRLCEERVATADGSGTQNDVTDICLWRRFWKDDVIGVKFDIKGSAKN